MNLLRTYEYVLAPFIKIFFLPPKSRQTISLSYLFGIIVWRLEASSSLRGTCLDWAACMRCWGTWWRGWGTPIVTLVLTRPPVQIIFRAKKSNAKNLNVRNNQQNKALKRDKRIFKQNHVSLFIRVPGVFNLCREKNAQKSTDTSILKRFKSTKRIIKCLPVNIIYKIFKIWLSGVYIMIIRVYEWKQLGLINN